ncbi:RagB/SusD domain-containing protein [Chitinophaga sp. YR627]|uniref:RagB/SusD family nutrient uptake outer membrane protein n=1 Tax=Chitinophaga sp. YR627 TaxID=1881041 RepID=UPI0008E2B6EC|nr:RagB/SusD family nutrient uptake outer membrane protein [Chitinophaga sp. YR627]SFN33465.1 RagB/SusD domain-containing protein [Chitinophaga sp. YR627]
MRIIKLKLSGKCIAGYLSLLVLANTACNKQLDELTPHNVNFEDQQFLTANGYTKATIGNYSYFASSNYENSWFNISEFRGNNVRIIDQTSTNNLADAKNLDAFNYTNSESKDYGYSYQFWQASYQGLLGINMVLKNVKEDETNPIILQAKAENLFLRANMFFNLVRVYGRPYYQSPETNPGVPLILSPITTTGNPPARATVKDTYAQILKDLATAIPLFSQVNVNSYAGKYAAFALMSRVYLYMSGTFSQPSAEYAKLSAQYADSVILNSGNRLLQGTEYINYYTSPNQSNKETIWAVNHEISTMQLPILLNQPTGVYTGSTQYSTGQVKPSPDLLGLLEAGDLRWNFYKVDKYPNNNTDTFSTTKYTYKYTAVYYSNAAVHHLRLAEVYLNRAEARLKAGDSDGALEDLNIIHTRAGLNGLTGLTGQDLFNAILKERRLELAFEGHNSYDNYRNGLPMIRNYGSFNSTPLTVNATAANVVLRIPLDVMTENANMKQNEQ